MRMRRFVPMIPEFGRKGLAVHATVEFKVDLGGGSLQFNHQICSMAGTHGVKEHLLTLE